MHELILYLEPAKNTPLRRFLESILSIATCNHYPSTAIKYPIHVSATGFFTVNTQADVTFIIGTYDHMLSKEKQHQRQPLQSSTLCQLPTIDLNLVTVSNPLSHNDGRFYSAKHLLLPITVPDDFKLLLTQCADIINNKQHSGEGSEQQQKVQRIRTKRIDHISLAYWDEPNATRKETIDWLRWSNGTGMEAMKQDITQQINEFQSSSSLDVSKAPWDMVLYERTFRGNGVGEKHVFMELSRWCLEY